ncbi:MAG: hypothetical protein MMC23_008015 [Stictis urceolatum]|nr:hypothetical protein [Stictis urceolata]
MSGRNKWTDAKNTTLFKALLLSHEIKIDYAMLAEHSRPRVNISYLLFSLLSPKSHCMNVYYFKCESGRPPNTTPKAIQHQIATLKGRVAPSKMKRHRAETAEGAATGPDGDEEDDPDENRPIRQARRSRKKAQVETGATHEATSGARMEDTKEA